MAPTLLRRQYDNTDDDNYQSNYNSYRTTIIIVICVILALKIALLILVCHLRSKRRAERRARGCHCYDDTDYWCTPWWYWNSDRLCRCPPKGAYVPGQPPRPYQPYGQAGFGYGAQPMGLSPPVATHPPQYDYREGGRAVAPGDGSLKVETERKRDASGERLMESDLNENGESPVGRFQVY